MTLSLRPSASIGREVSTEWTASGRVTRLLLVAAAAGALLLAVMVAPARAAAVKPTRRLQLVLPLKADYAALARYTTEVTTPGSPLYDHYESIAWLARRFGASLQDQRRVASALRRAGATRIRLDRTGLFVDAQMRTGAAQRLFRTDIEFVDATHGLRYEAPASSVQLPADLRGLVTGVVGLDTEPITAAQGSGGTGIGNAPSPSTSGYSPVSGTPSGCAAGLAAGGFTPNQYLTAYNFMPLQSEGILGQGERVALIEIDGYDARDVDTFAKCFGLDVPRINAFGVGVSHPLAPGGEATLDLEVLDATAPDLRSIDVYESKSEASDVLMALTSPLQTNAYKPEVISASLGLCESQTVQAVGRSGIDAAEAALEEAADTGISFLAASGDYGSADCVTSNAANAQPDPQLAVNYPASSPYVTAVGGTNLVLNTSNAIESEVVWNDGTAASEIGASGGGFSALFPRPSYQTGVVTENHRAVPDVALLADIAPGYDVYCTARPDCVSPADPTAWQTVGGTSAATPLFAGGVALIDQMLREHDLTGIGLPNPLLYEIGLNPTEAALVFDPVSTGSNDVGEFLETRNSPLGCCTAGPGYNEATGWGGVNVGALATTAMTVEPPLATVAVRLPANQRPVQAEHILATVTCSSSCLFTAYAKVTIGDQAPFLDHAALARTGASRTVKIGFSKGQLSRLTAALQSHVRVTAIVTGAIVDPAFNIERQSAQSHLVIRH